MSTENAAWAHRVLRIGLAFAFIYPPIAALSDPVSWAGYFPHFVHTLPINIYVLLHAFGVLEVVLGLWILSGWRVRVPAAIAALILLAIVVLDASDFSILFRDLSIAAIAIALVLWPTSAPSGLRPSPPAGQGGQG